MTGREGRHSPTLGAGAHNHIPLWVFAHERGSELWSDSRTYPTGYMRRELVMAVLSRKLAAAQGMPVMRGGHESAQ